MTKRIFKYVFGFVIILYFVIIAITIGVFYDNLQNQTKSELKKETVMVANAVEKLGNDYFTNFKTDGYRITWIDKTGKVLYDSSSEVENLDSHLDREEIKKAFETGFAESSRYSKTITSRQYYCAKLLTNETVLRLSVSHDSVVMLLLKMLYPIIFFSLLIIGACVLISYQISKKLVKPLNDINLDEPTVNVKYKELIPLLSRLEQQQISIRCQEEELKRRKDEFNAVTFGMKEGLILLGESNNVLITNRVATNLLKQGVKIENVLSSSVLEFKNKVYNVEITPIKEQGAVVLLQDVSDKYQAERLRREFTSNVSHELKTPLQSISGRAELLVNGLVKEQDKLEFVNQIYSESKRMITLVEDIIHLSSLEENNDFVFEMIDLFENVQETVRSLKGQAEKAKVSLSAYGTSVNILAVPRLVNVVLFNLIDNAIKYNKENGVVSVSLKEENTKVVLKIKDTGIGIPNESIERVFERFYRVDKSRSKSVGGTGLGLSIVKHACKILGAEIKIHSILNEGTTVSVIFNKN